MVLACKQTASCEEDLEDLICQEQPPNPTSSTVTCTAYFVRWFYNPTTNTCEEVGYSGCSATGFATQAECQECVCLSVN